MSGSFRRAVGCRTSPPIKYLKVKVEQAAVFITALEGRMRCSQGTVEERVRALPEYTRDLAERILAGSRRGLAGVLREVPELLIGSGEGCWGSGWVHVWVARVWPRSRKNTR